MDRPLASGSRWLFGGLVLASVALSAGCRSTRSEVPAAKPYARTSDQLPEVGFSSQPRMTPTGPMLDSLDAAPGGRIDDQLAATAAQQSSATIYGTPTASERLAMPTNHGYGAPGSAGLDPTANGGTSALGHALMQSGDSATDMLKGDPNLRQAAGPPQ